MNETERIFTITKAEPDKMQVFGWASVAITADGQQISDHEGDVIQPDELEKAAYEYVLKFRDTGERHDPDKRKKGKLIESVVLTKEKQEAMGIPAGYLPEGWWVGFQITDEDAWAKIKSGEYKMFSVEGRGERESLDPPAGTGGIAKGFNEIIKYQHEGRRVNGVGVLVQDKDGRLLVGTRLDGKHAGQICGAGGHIENGETPSQAAVREAREEFGIECRNLKELGYKDSGSAYGQSCIFLCTEWDGEPSTDEEEMTALEWLTPAELKDRKLFRPFEESLKFLSVAKSFKEIMKFNPYHDAGGRFASANGGGFRGPMMSPDGKGGGARGGGRDYGHASEDDLNWAMKTIAENRASGKGGGSLEGHIKDGKLTPEREALHREIIDTILEGKTPVDGQATMTMLGGGPSSGKSSVMSTDTSKDPHAVTVNSDDIKKFLPDYAEMAHKDPNAANFYHAESSILANQLYEVASREGYNIIFDGTGDGSTASVEARIATAQKNGMRVEAKYVSVNTDDAYKRSQNRYNEDMEKFLAGKGDPPREIPEKYLRDCHGKVTDISVEVASKFDHIELWDNNGEKGQAKKIAEGGNGKPLTIIKGQEQAVDNFLSKSSAGRAGFTISSRGEISKKEN